MSNIQPKKQDLDGVEYLSLDEATKITISGDDSSSSGARIELAKDLTTAPIISHLSGSGFDFGVLGDFTFPQMILSKQKLQAVVTPLPATDTLKINKKIVLDDGAGNTGTLDINGTDLEISSSGSIFINGSIFPPIKPSISISVGIVSSSTPAYTNGIYYVSYLNTWNKSLYVSPIHGAGNTYVTQDANNSFTGLYDIVNGVITIPTGFTGFWSVEWSSALARGSPTTPSIVAQLGSGTPITGYSAFATNSSATGGYITSGTQLGTRGEFSTITLSGVAYLTAGQTIAVWTNSAAQVNIGGDYSPAHFRVSFLGY
jgi:hypothetical protein